MKWKEKLSWEQAQAVRKELAGVGLERSQIGSLMNHSGRVTPLELDLMLRLPRNPHSGKKASISVAKAAISTVIKLDLATRKPQSRKK